MPALNFQKQFAPDVKNGKKRQTIRAFRKDKRDPKPGEMLYLYTGMRTKNCQLLRADKCASTWQLSIEDGRVTVGIDTFDENRLLEFAEADGFSSVDDFFDFFNKNHGLPFYGLLIEW